jgi:hypothetical protein
MHCVAGIDPGLTGAIVVLSGAAPRPRLFIFDMPAHRLKVGKKERKRVDVNGLLTLMYTVKALSPTLVVLEDVGGFTGQSPSAAFSFGKSCGYVEYAVTAAELPLHLVSPQTWQKKLGVNAGHDGARLGAARCFPDYASDWKKDGRASAALLALYGARCVQSWA